jgi:protein TonB
VMASTVAALTPEPPPTAPVPIEIVRIDPPPAAEPPKPPRRPPPPQAKPRPQEKIVAPRLITQPTEITQPTTAPAPGLLDDAPRRDMAPTSAAESSDSSRRVLAGAAASSAWSMPGGTRGEASTAGKLFATGDLPMPAGRRGTGGTGGTAVASTGSGKGDALGDTSGLTSFARPLGGYQTRPRYPDTARREGIEGETLLRFQVLTTGRVAAVSVARTAGHPDLDRAAVEAVTTWLFEPARRGKEAVVVWVTLPVRFQLDARGE